MEKYKCEFCNYDTTIKANYKKHIETPKHKKKYKYSTEIQPKFNQNSTEIQPKFNQNSTKIQPKSIKKVLTLNILIVSIVANHLSICNQCIDI